MKKYFIKALTLFIVVIMMIGIMFDNSSLKVAAASVDDYSITYTDGIKFMSSSMADNFIGFIYNKSYNDVTSTDRNENNLYNYLTGKLTPGTSEYVNAQCAFIQTQSKFVDAHIGKTTAMSEKAVQALIDSLTKELGSANPSDAVANEALADVKNHIVKIMQYACGWSNESIGAFEAYKNVSGLVGKIKSLTLAIESSANTLIAVANTNQKNAYSYYADYVNLRSDNKQAFEFLMDYNEMAYSSIFDGFSSIFSSLGWGNHWGDDDIIVLLRTFAEFTYHSMQESNNSTGGSGSSGENTEDGTIGSETLAPKDVWDISATSSDNVTARLDGNMLYIYGGGKMKDWSSSETTPWYADRNLISNIIMEDAVLNIGNNAFSGCTVVSSMVITDSVTSIGDSAFSNCTSLTSIVIPDGVTSIGYGVFSGCNSLTNVTIGNEVSNIGNYAFNYCASLTSITIPESITSIGNGMFYGCASLKNIVIIGSITSIGERAFYDCTLLESIEIPDSVTSIGKRTFYGCTSLENVEIPDSVSYVGYESFAGCESLIEIENGIHYVDTWVVGSEPDVAFAKLREGTLGIVDYAFTAPYYSDAISNLVSLEIPQSVKYVQTETFVRCFRLAEVINKSDVRICVQYFMGSDWEDMFYVEPNSRVGKIEFVGDYMFFRDDFGFYYTHNSELYLLGYIGDDTELVLPDYNGEQYGIARYAFYGMDDITSVTFIQAPFIIGECAFDNCENIEFSKFVGCETLWKESVLISNYNTSLADVLKFEDHLYNQEVIVDTYKAIPSTCIYPASYYYSCACGLVGTEVFEYGEATGHSFTNYVSNNDATEMSDGTKTAKCDNCDATDTVTDIGTILASVKGFKDKVSSLENIISTEELYTSIREALTIYNKLTDYEKELVVGEYDVLKNTINDYNSKAEVANAELEAATEVAFSPIVVYFGFLSLLFFLLKKRFWI